MSNYNFTDDDLARVAKSIEKDKKERKENWNKYEHIKHWTELEAAWVAIRSIKVFHDVYNQHRPRTGLAVETTWIDKGYNDVTHIFHSLEAVKKAYPNALGYVNLLDHVGSNVDKIEEQPTTFEWRQ